MDHRAAPDLRALLASLAWHARAACRDGSVDFFPSEELHRKVPGSPSILLPLLVCARCPVRRECLADALVPSVAPHGIREHNFGDENGGAEIVSIIPVVGIFGGTLRVERRAVEHLDVGEAVAMLEQTFTMRLAHRVALYREWASTRKGSRRRIVERVEAELAAREAGAAEAVG